MRNRQSLPGRVLSNEDADKLLHERGRKQTNTTSEEDFAFLKFVYVIVGLAIVVSIGIQYIRSVNRRNRAQHSIASDRTALKMLDYIHSSVNEACNDSNIVSITELHDHFGSSPQYDEALHHITNTVFRDILFVNATFKSLNPKWPARCHFAGWAFNAKFELSRNTLIPVGILGVAIAISLVIVHFIFGRESVEREASAVVRHLLSLSRKGTRGVPADSVRPPNTSDKFWTQIQANLEKRPIITTYELSGRKHYAIVS